MANENDNISAARESETRPQAAYGSQLKIGAKFAISSCVLLVLAMCVFWLVTNRTTENILRQQADSLGNTLARQTAILATELVLANDLISMNVLLNQLTREAAVSEVAILSIEDQVIAISGNASAAAGSATQPSLFESYVAPIALQDSLAGYVRVSLDQRYIEQGVTRNFIFMLIALSLLLLASVCVTVAFTQHLVTFPLRMLTFSMQSLRRGEVRFSPFGERMDEVGTLIRTYNRLLEDLEDPDVRQVIFEEETRSPLDTPSAYRKPGSSIVSILHLNISNYRQALRQQESVETIELLNTYYFYIHEVTALYNGSIEKCAGDEILITFGAAQSDEDHCFHAVCAALLFLDLADTLGRELEAESLSSLQFRAGLHSGELLTGVLSSLAQNSYTVAGENLALARQICEEGPVGKLLISEAAYIQADAEHRLVTDEFNEIVDEATGDFIKTWQVEEPMVNYKALLARQVEHLLSQDITV